MAEVARLIGLLQASAQRRSQEKSVGCVTFPSCSSLSIAASYSVEENSQVSYNKSEVVPGSFVEALQYIDSGNRLPPKPTEPLSQDFKTDLNNVVSKLSSVIPPGAPRLAPTTQVKEPACDFVNLLAVANCKRIFAAAEDPTELKNIGIDLNVPPFPINKFEINKMAGRLPVLTTSNLPQASAQETSATASPARGSAMLNSIFKSVRVPEFRFKWQFWAEKGQQSAPSSKADKASGAEEYASRPKPLGEQIISVKEFYQHFNNIPVDSLKLRDSIHLFHLGVKPLWEDPRNARGGAYYFRISKELAPQFWHEICLLAVGDVLQAAVETKRESFNDDICGISYSVRWNAVQVAIWNRDSDNEVGKEKLLQTILEKLSAELQPKKDSYWYKAHKDHKGFAAPDS